MSHVTTAGMYEGFVQLCSGYGGYNPGSPNLTISALQELSVKARQSLEDLTVAKSAMNKATNDREIAFARLPKLVSAISFTLAASGASEQTMEDIRVFLRQMSSRKKFRDPIPSDQATLPVKANKPFSQRGYEAMTKHFAHIVQLASQQALYQPKEGHLSVCSLRERVSALHSLNTSVSEARATFGHARLRVHEVFDGEQNSIVSTARAAKKYLRAVYGLNSNEYKQVLKMKLTKEKI